MKLVKLIQDLLSSRRHCVKVWRHMSSFRDITKEYVRVLFQVLCSEKTLLNDVNPSMAHFIYADDATLYHPLKEGESLIYESTAQHATISYAESSPVQLALDYTSIYWKEIRLNHNVRKSPSMIFTLQESISIPPVVVAEKSLSRQPEVKLLGVTIQQHHKFDWHIYNIID